ncbi:hypothetical protein [Chondromyces crocatus]|uniref:Secreted protein n=1 Tax=Chondromyces crocatus TaxID=52 RepID=A0A0K1EKL8_CHOCO|nr:hypothetical protein [Chondromyces crocatus]AKT41425.1 uncharacterized protein CMC5_056250 [Chondromyces crocatus]
MVRYPVKRLFALLAFALGLCLPLRASAAILQACEHDAETRVVAQEAVHSSACDGVSTHGDDAGALNAAPLCDPEGASVVAPPRIYPIADARIDAASACGDTDTLPTIGLRSSDPAPLGELAAAPAWAVLVPDLTLPLPTIEGLAVASTPVATEPRPGFGPGIYHPPR